MALTAAQIKQKINNLLADNTTGAISAADVREVLTDIVDSFGATQVENTMPEWAASLTFQTDGTDSGEFCRYADTLGNIRLWVTKVDDNTGNAPPSDPNVTENTYWKEVSASNSAAFPEWAAGIYGEGLVIVYHMNAVYKLDAAARPYNSVNIQTEIAAGDWIDLTGSSSPNVYNGITFSPVEGVVSVPFNYLTTNIAQKVIDAQYDFQPNTTGAVDSYGAKITLFADGDSGNIPTFTGFTKWPNSDDWDNTAGAKNEVAFMLIGSTYYYTIVNSSTDTLPVANNVFITGSLTVGQQLSSNYTYYDADGDIESGTTFQWYRADSQSPTNREAISGANSQNYTLQSADNGKYIQVGVTPKNSKATGAESLSAWTSVIQSSDTTAPQASFNPSNGGINVAIDSNIIITFNEPILNTDASEVTDVNVSNLIILKEDNSSGADIAFSATINAGKTQITINPTSDLPNSQVVYVAVNNFEDVAGNEETSGQSASFTTIASAAFTNTKSLSGNGSTSYAQETSRVTQVEPLTGSNKTWSFWMYSDSGYGTAIIWGVSNAGAASGLGRGVSCFVIDENHGTLPNIFRFTIFQTSSIYRLIQSSVAVTRDAWHHIAVTYVESTNTMELYIDGVKDTGASRGDAGSWGAYNSRSDNRLALMGLNDANGGAIVSQYAGEFDEFSVWNKVLSGTEVSELIDDSGANIKPADLDSHSAVSDRLIWLRFEDDLTDEDGLVNSLSNTNCTFDANVPS